MNTKDLVEKLKNKVSKEFLKTLEDIIEKHGDFEIPERIKDDN